MNTTNLKRLRKTSKLTQEDVAERLNVSRQTVAKWETGESLPDIDSCIALANLYGVTIDDMVSSVKDPFHSKSPKGKYLFGVVKIDKNHCIKLPDKALDVFELKENDKLLLLGDINQGLAMVKLDGVLKFTSAISKTIKDSEASDENIMAGDADNECD